MHPLVTPRAVPLHLSPRVPDPDEPHLPAPIAHLGNKEIEKISSARTREQDFNSVQRLVLMAEQKVKSATGEVGGKAGWEFGQLPQDNFPHHLRLRGNSLIFSPGVSLPHAAGHTSSMPVTEYAWPFTRPNGVRASDSAALLVCNRAKNLNEPLSSE